MNIAILGAGSIVPDFLEAASQIADIHLYAIWGRESSLERMEKFQKEYAIDKMYLDFEELLADDNVEAVYVALLNHLHYSYAKQAVIHKKHVIVEKPFASTYEQAEDLVTCAKEHSVMVFEAISNQYMPNYLKTAELIGEIGDVKIIEMNFSQYSKRYDQFKAGNILPVFDPKQSGGALMDLNMYNVHYVLGLFGVPRQVRYYANIEKGIDTSGILIMEYSGFQCVCVGAKDCKTSTNINIQGDRGWIHSEDTPNVYNTFSLCKNTGEVKDFALNEGKPRLFHELKTFVDMVNNQDESAYKGYCQHTLEVQKYWMRHEERWGLRLWSEFQ
jgi:predicted dehydrogenase